MILWYSGCGNSQFVAKQLALGLHEEMQFIPDAARQDLTIKIADDGILGIVFPVYCWSVPKLVSKFIRSMKIQGKPKYVFGACTCGDTTGYTARVLRSDLKKAGLKLDAFFTFQMPETYVNLPGFNLDTPEKEQHKIAQTRERLSKTIQLIQKRIEGDFNPLIGSQPWLKTYVVKPLFYSLLITDRKFSVSDACNGCSKCAKSCPLKNISMENEHPHWHGNCTNCMSCYHRCPKHAINFGTVTETQGQYYFKG